MKLRNRLAIVLLAIGSTQMIGDLTGFMPLRGVGLASGIAPFPKVFCAADGYEAFAASFTVEGELPGGEKWKQRLDPVVYARLRGSYNRRNVYGAALACAPRLPEELRDSLLVSALAPGSAMRRELGIPDEVTELRVHIEPREGESEGPWTYTYQNQ